MCKGRLFVAVRLEVPIISKLTVQKLWFFCVSKFVLVTNWACDPVWGWGSLSEIKLVASAAEIYFKFRLLV